MCELYSVCFVCMDLIVVGFKQVSTARVADTISSRRCQYTLRKDEKTETDRRTSSSCNARALRPGT